MRELFACIEDRKIGLFESPTGTVGAVLFIDRADFLGQIA